MGVMDLREKESSSSCEDMMMMSESNKKSCVDCKTTKTPLWRGGPAGPKSLCNACGIRYRKRRVSLGLVKGPEKKKERSQAQAQAHSITITETDKSGSVNENGVAADGGFSESLKMNLMALGKDLMIQGSPSPSLKKQRCWRRRKLGEEEQAAVCLLALSCGYVFA